MSLSRIYAWSAAELKDWELVLGNDPAKAVADLITYLFQAAGMHDMPISPNELKMDAKAFLHELTKDESELSKTDAYPLALGSKKSDNQQKLGKTFRNVFTKNNTCVLLGHKEEARHFLNWLLAMMVTPVRSIRHTSVASCCVILKALESVGKSINATITAYSHQRGKFNPADKRLQKIQVQMNELMKQRTEVSDFKEKILKATLQRTRDSQVPIRCLMLGWIKDWTLENPEVFSDLWCTHLFALMHDRDHNVRKQAMEVLYAWFEKLPKIMEKWASKFSTSLRDRCADVDANVAVLAVKILTINEVVNTLPDATVDAIANEVLCSAYPKVREAAAYFINEHIFSAPGIIVHHDQQEAPKPQDIELGIEMMLEYLESFADTLIWRTWYVVEAFGEKAPCLISWDYMLATCTRGEGNPAEVALPLHRKKRDAMLCLMDASVLRVALKKDDEEMKKAISAFLPHLATLFDICSGEVNQLTPLTHMLLVLVQYMKTHADVRAMVPHSAIVKLEKVLDTYEHVTILNNAATALRIICEMQELTDGQKVSESILTSIHDRLAEFFKGIHSPNNRCKEFVIDMHRMQAVTKAMGDGLCGDGKLFDKMVNVLYHEVHDYETFALKTIQLLFSCLNWQIGLYVKAVTPVPYITQFDEVTLKEKYVKFLDLLIFIIGAEGLDMRLHNACFRAYLSAKRMEYGASQVITLDPVSTPLSQVMINVEHEERLFHYLSQLIDDTAGLKVKGDQVNEEGLDIGVDESIVTPPSSQYYGQVDNTAIRWIEESIMRKKASDVTNVEKLVLAHQAASAIQKTPVAIIRNQSLGQLVLSLIDKSKPKMFQDVARALLKIIKDEALAMVANHADFARHYFAMQLYSVQNTMEDVDPQTARSVCIQFVNAIGFSIPPCFIAAYDEHVQALLHTAIDPSKPDCLEMFRTMEPFLRFKKPEERVELVRRRCEDAGMDPQLFVNLLEVGKKRKLATSPALSEGAPKRLVSSPMPISSIPSSPMPIRGSRMPSSPLPSSPMPHQMQSSRIDID
eukprot:GEMP01006959.1.p1 GENE.GEMP01006959.1~~GEMP01006959.1.p1  ORF type:complete len:1029 (+),score=214.99 GEMP01006959.1:149-3235(+)